MPLEESLHPLYQNPKQEPQFGGHCPWPSKLGKQDIESGSLYKLPSVVAPCPTHSWRVFRCRFPKRGQRMSAKSFWIRGTGATAGRSEFPARAKVPSMTEFCI